VFLLVLAHPGSRGQRSVKRSLLLLLFVGQCDGHLLRPCGCKNGLICFQARHYVKTKPGFGLCLFCVIVSFAFSAVMLLVGCQEEHMACKKLSDEVLVICLKRGANDLHMV